jgi:tetratricopeptide (TPR) repeat protein
MKQSFTLTLSNVTNSCIYGYLNKLIYSLGEYMIKFKRTWLFSLLFIIVFASNMLLFSESITAATAYADTVLVEMNRSVITTRDLRNTIDSLPLADRFHSLSPEGQITEVLPPLINRFHFMTVEGQRVLLNQMITEEIVYNRGLQLGIDQRDDMQRLFRAGTRPIVNRLHLNELFAREHSLDMVELQRYYEQNKAIFSTPPSVTIEHLQIESDNLPQVMDELNRGTDMGQFIEADFSHIINTHSINEFSAGHNGFIRGIRLDGNIPGIGVDRQLEYHIAGATVDSDIIHGPFETETGVHFFKKLSHQPSTFMSFDEVREDVENRMRRELMGEFYNRLIDRMRMRYNVSIMTDILDGMVYFTIPERIANVPIVTGSHPDIVMTFKDFGAVLGNAFPLRQLTRADREWLMSMLNHELNSRLINISAQEESFLENHMDRDDIQKMHRFAVLNGFMLDQVHETIQVTDEEILEFFERYTEYNMIPAFRNIRQFVANDRRTARQHHRTIRRLLRNEQEHEIALLTRQESVLNAADGVVLNIARDGNIPGTGRDQNYNNRVFNIRIGTLSDVFRNVNNQYVFFYVIREEAERPRPLEDVANEISRMIHRDKADAMFAEILNDLKAENNVVTHFDRLVNLATPDVFFNLVEDALLRMNVDEAMTLLDELIANNRGTEYEQYALLMKAFIAFDNLRDRNRAIRYYEEFLSKYHEGEMREFAEKMLEELRSGKDLELMIIDR